MARSTSAASSGWILRVSSPPVKRNPECSRSRRAFAASIAAAADRRFPEICLALSAAVKLAARRGQSPGQSGVVIIEPVSWKDAKKLVGRDGIEPPTPGFSVLCSTN